MAGNWTTAVRPRLVILYSQPTLSLHSTQYIHRLTTYMYTCCLSARSGVVARQPLSRRTCGGSTLPLQPDPQSTLHIALCCAKLSEPTPRGTPLTHSLPLLTHPLLQPSFTLHDTVPAVYPPALFTPSFRRPHHIHPAAAAQSFGHFPYCASTTASRLSINPSPRCLSPRRLDCL